MTSAWLDGRVATQARFSSNRPVGLLPRERIGNSWRARSGAYHRQMMGASTPDRVRRFVGIGVYALRNPHGGVEVSASASRTAIKGSHAVRRPCAPHAQAVQMSRQPAPQGTRGGGARSARSRGRSWLAGPEATRTHRRGVRAAQIGTPAIQFGRESPLGEHPARGRVRRSGWRGQGPRDSD